MRKLLFSVLILAVGAATCSAQQMASHAPDARGGVSGVELIRIAQISGAAFSARVSLEFKRDLPDGTHILQRSTILLARDSQGRVYRERRQILPASDPAEPRLEASIVEDPAAGTRTVCERISRVCTVTAVRPYLPSTRPADQIAPDKGAIVTHTELGKERMQGLEVLHDQTRMEFPAGTIGNDQAVFAGSESWFSPTMQLLLAAQASNPSGASMSQRVTELNLSEPETSWFESAPGFRIVDTRHIARQ